MDEYKELYENLSDDLKASTSPMNSWMPSRAGLIGHVIGLISIDVQKGNKDV